jgi:transcriptional regulator with XRE-family HTH domain
MHDNTDSAAALPGDRLRDVRLSRGFTQEALADRAGLSLGVVKKIERGGSARLETYHALARALRVRTSALFEPAGPHTTRRTDDHAIDLMPLRQAVSPPFTTHGPLGADTVDTEPDLHHLWRTARRLDQSYHQDDYVRVSELLPALVRSANAAVAHFDGGPERTEAMKLRADVLQQAGRYLTQVRAYDLAHLALRDAMRDAAAAGDRLSSAAAVYLQGWALIRQGRLDEAERLATATADDIEPRISRASRDELGVWGRLLVKASSGAARNNRPQEAREILRLARTAGAAIGGGKAGGPYRCGEFSASSVAFQAIENYMVAEKPGMVLGLAARVPSGAASTSNTYHRHLLDVARAHTLLRQRDEATGILCSLRDDSPDWLRQQQMAADTFQDVLRLSRRRVTARQRELAAFFGVA